MKRRSDDGRGLVRPAGTHVHPTAGTIFHKSSTSLHLWFYAIYLISSTRCGISAKQLERELGVNYKTAWRMFNLIRNDLMNQDGDGPLAGVVEMDETFYGGKPKAWPKIRKNQHSDKKAIVFGAVEHSVSHKWLQSYLDEYVWRYNRRDGDGSMFHALLTLLSASSTSLRFGTGISKPLGVCCFGPSGSCV